MDGILYLHDLAGRALQTAHADIERLKARIAELEAAQAEGGDVPR